MSVVSAQAVTVDFTTRNGTTGVGVNADSLPSGTLVKNGVDNGASVTVTNVSAGVYKASVTLPTLASADIVQLRISATVNSVTDACVIWTDTADIANIQSGLATPTNITAGTITTVTNLTNAPTAGDLTATMKTSVQTADAAAITAANLPTLAQMQAGLPTDTTIQADAAAAIAATTPLNSAGTTTLLGRIPGTVQPQTGDSYGRLGAPAGASVSEDILTANTGIILAQGLVGTNIGVRNTSYDGSGNLLGADLCLYDTAAHALANDGATGLLHKFTIASTFAGTQMTQQSTRQIS